MGSEGECNEIRNSLSLKDIKKIPHKRIHNILDKKTDASPVSIKFFCMNNAVADDLMNNNNVT